MMTNWEKLHPMGTLPGDPIPGAPELAARGNCTAGVRTLTMVRKDAANVAAGLRDGAWPRYDRALQVEVWYPALAGKDGDRAVYTDHMGRNDLGNLEPFTMGGRAYRDAAPDPSAGPRPAVVISHGYPGSRYLMVNLAEHLASLGYVVLAPGHEDNTYENFAPERSWESALIHRSADQRFVISQLGALNEEGFLKGMIQPENVGLVGFSMGGYGAIRTIGGRVAESAKKNSACLPGDLEEAADYHGVKAVKAAALFAPATMLAEPGVTGDIDIPTLWFCGTADHTVEYEKVRSYCQEAERSERIFVSYEGCGHNVANNPAPPESCDHSWEIYKRWSDPVWDTRRLNNANCHFLGAFFDLYLRGDQEKAAFLQVPTVRGAEAGKENYWKGFQEGTAAGICLERFGRK